MVNRAGVGPAFRSADAAARLFPASLWFLACFFLLGRLGLWLDDDYYIQRTPETLAIESLYLERWIHFWRPLYRAVVPALLTLFWRHDAALHLLSAAVHGLVAALLWRLLWALGVNRLSAGAAALLFLTWPVHFEPVFWVSALPTSLGAALALGGLLLTVKWARAECPAWSIALVIPGAFAAASFNEQPAMLLLALPAAALAAGGSRRRAAVPLVLGAAAGIAYTACHLAFVHVKPVMGHETFLIPLSQWPRQAAKAAEWALDWNSLHGFAGRAWARGLEAMSLAPGRAWATLVVLGIGGALWVFAQARSGDQRRGGARPRHAPLLLLGLLAALAPWLPIVAFDYWLNPRLCYAPGLGLAVLLGAAGSGLAALTRGLGRWAPPCRALAAVAAATAVTGCAVLTLGVQRAFQARAEQDRVEMAELRRLWPDPPAGAVFAPVSLALPDPGPAGPNKVDEQMWSALSAGWSAPWCVRLAYRRSDLRCGHTNWRISAIQDADRRGAVVRGVGRVPWRMLMPFEVGPTGRIRAVTRVRVHREGDSAEFGVPLGRAAAEAAGQDALLFELRP